MTSLSDRIPEPTKSWTVDHEPNPVEGIVTERREVWSEKYDRTFSILEIGEDNGTLHEVLCGRADLAAWIRRDDPQVGDRVAVQFWGLQGSRNVYTAIKEGPGGQGTLKVADPLEASPPLDDADFSPGVDS